MKTDGGALDALRNILGVLRAETDGYIGRRFALSVALIAASSALAALVPVVYKLAIDTLPGHASASSAVAPALLIAGYVTAQYAQRVIDELRGLTHGFALQRLNRQLSRRLFEHIVRLPMRYHLERKTGAIGEILNQGLNGCQMLLQHLLLTFLPVTLEFLAIVAVLIHFGHAAYLWMFAISAAAYAFAFWRGAADIVEPARVASGAHIQAHSVLADSLLNCETVKYFNAESHVCGRYVDALTHKESAVRDLLGLRTRNTLLVSTIYAGSLGGSLGMAGYEVMRGTMTVGDFVLINSYVARLLLPLQSIGFAIRDIAQALAYIRRMLETLRESRETDMGHRQASTPRAASELIFEHVSFSYGAGRRIMDRVSFTVPAGRVTAIVGSSGSGKSTLIRLLFRLFEPDSGRILLDGKPIAEMALQELRRCIAVVPQDTVLLNDTIGANIGFGRLGATQSEIDGAARVAHLHDFILSLPEGYATQVGERGLKLSGGERQRIAIARAVLRQPRIFVFDEATSSLDSTTEREILGNLAEAAVTGTTLVIAHRLSTVMHADQILVLGRGAIVERGTHAQLLELGGNYASLWRAQNQFHSSLTMC